MRTWIKPFIAGAFASAALLGGVAAWSTDALPAAMAMHRHGGDHVAAFRSMMVDKLALDAAQTTRLDALVARMQATHAALHGTGDFHADLQAVMAGNAFDRVRAQALVDAKLQAVQAGAPTTIAALGDFYDALRPDQQQKVRDFMAQHHGHGEHGGMEMRVESH